MFAKVVLFCAALAAVNAAAILAPAVLTSGSSISSRQQDGLGNYAFSYGIRDGLGATNSRSEVGDGLGNKKGSYTIGDIDGRARVVEYVADGLGFRAAVKTNEPGTAASAPAAALIASPYAAPVAPAPIAVAPVAAPIALGAPLSYSTSIAHGAPIATPLGLGIGTLGYGIGTLGYGIGPLGLGKGLIL